MSEQNEKLFTQEEVNQIVQGRLARSREQHERKMEQIAEDVDRKHPNYKAKAIDLYKRLKLMEVGVKSDKMEEVLPVFDTFETQEEIDKAIEVLGPDLNPDYLDTYYKNKTQSKPYADPSGKKSKRIVWNPFSK